jgi:DnaK suppressor protein
MDTNATIRAREILVSELGENGRLLRKLRKSASEQTQRYIEDGGAFASDTADTASAGAERESDYHLVLTQGGVVQEIEEAIRRIDDGNYGCCERCEKPIDPRRLQVLPYARFCLKCQEKTEKARRF